MPDEKKPIRPEVPVHERMFLETLGMTREQLVSFIERVYWGGGMDDYVDFRWKRRDSEEVLKRLASHGIIQNRGRRSTFKGMFYGDFGPWQIKLTRFALDWAERCRLDWQLRGVGSGVDED